MIRPRVVHFEVTGDSVFRRLHHAFLRDRISDQRLLGNRRGHRRGVRVRGGHDDLPHIEIGKQRLQMLTKLREHGVMNAHEVTGDEDGLIRCLASLDGFERHRSGDDRSFDTLRNARRKLPRQRHGPVRRDADRGGADAQFRSLYKGG